MKRLYFSDRHAPLVDVLFRGQVDGESVDGLSPLFKQLTDVVLFSAMIGKYYNRSSELVGQSGGELQISAFRNNEDGIVFLLGLQEIGDPAAFKGDADECWDLLQRYSVGGMDTILEWVSGLTEDKFEGVLLEKLREVALASKKPTTIKIKKPKRII